MSIGLVDAVAGSGKTTAIINNAVNLAIEHKNRVCIALPTTEVIDEKFADAVTLAAGRIPVHRVHGDVGGSASVGTKLDQVLKDTGSKKPAVLFTTHKTFNDCPNWIGTEHWKFYVDELFDPIEHKELRLPYHYGILTELLELLSPSDTFSEVRIASGNGTTFKQRLDGSDDVDAVLLPITKRLDQPKRWKVYVNTDNYRTVTSGIGSSRLVDQREKGAVLYFWAVQQPWFEREGLDVTLASACFTDRLLYKLWQSNGTVFEPDTAVTNQLLAHAHNGQGLELHCMNINNWSKWLKNGRRLIPIKGQITPQHKLEQLIRDTFGADPFIFNANKDWKHTELGPNAKKINVVEHGKNAHSSYLNVAFMPSLLPVSEKWQFIRWLGFTESDIRDEYYHSHAYQTVFRTAARQQNRTGTVRAIVPGRAACEYIRRKAPGAKIIVHEVLDPAGSRGRPRKYETPEQARAADAQRRRAKRQAAKLAAAYAASR